MKTLREVYESHKADLETLYKKLQEEGLWNDVSYPLLMSTWDNEPIPEAMLFGQETNGWGYNDTIEGLMEDYRKFNLGENYNSLFWRYLWEESAKLRLKGRHPFLWNNINKIGNVDSAGRPDQRVTDLENKYFNVLKDELLAIKPKLCIFFTGPNYDSDLKAKLPDLEVLPIEGFHRNELVRLRSQYLPEHSYRTYHPGYGNRYKEWYDKVLKEQIIDQYLDSKKRCKEIIEDLAWKTDPKLAYGFYKKKYADWLLRLKQFIQAYISDGNVDLLKYNLSPDILTKKDLNFLCENYNLTISLIDEEIEKSLYSWYYEENYRDYDMRLLFELAGIEKGDQVECINCDPGMISLLSRFVKPVADHSNFSAYEKQLKIRDNEKAGNTNHAEKFYFLMHESFRYISQDMTPKDIKMSSENLLDSVGKLDTDQSLIEIMPRNFLIDKKYENFRKEILKSRKLYAIMELHVAPYQRNLSALIFKGKPTDVVSMLMKDNLNNNFEYEKFYQSVSNIKWPYILEPSITKEINPKIDIITLSEIVSQVEITDTLEANSEPLLLMSLDSLTSNFPLQPINLDSLETKKTKPESHSDRVYKIEEGDFIVVGKKDKTFFSGFFYNDKKRKIMIKEETDIFLTILQLKTPDFFTQYLAQIFHTDELGIKDELQELVDTQLSFENLILNLFIKKIDLHYQQRFISQNSNQIYNDIIFQLEERNLKYENTVREKKHRFSHKILDANSAWEMFIDHLNSLDNKPFNKEEWMDTLTPMKVQDLIEDLNKAFNYFGKEIGEIADQNFSSWKISTINLREFIEMYATTKMNYSRDIRILVNTNPSLSEKDFKIKFQKEGLEEILDNIYHNAQKHAFSNLNKEKDKIIKININPMEDHIEVIMANNGISLDESQKLPDSKKTSDNDWHRSEGIGLKKIKEIMKFNGGFFKLNQHNGEEFKTVYQLNFKKN